MSGPPEIPELAFTDPIAYSKTLPSIYHLSPPHGAITDDNHGAYVVIVAWIMLCFFSISVLTRLLTRTVPVITTGTDDILIGISMVFAVAQSAVIHRSATNGLGRPQDSLSPSLFTTYAKTYYTANLLFILTIAFAKASLIFLIVRLSPARSVRRMCYGLLALIGLWALIMFFLFAFQCPTPSPWDYTQQCPISTSGLYYAFGATDILTDLLVTLLPAYVIWSVQIPLRKRITVIAVFASRLLVPLLAALRLASLPHYLDREDNRSWEAVTPQTWLQIVQCVSIITACIPCLKPFLESLESGFMDMSMATHTGATYGGASSGSGNHGTGATAKTRSKTGTGVESYALSSFTGSNTGADINVHTKAAERYAGRHTPNGGVMRGEEKDDGDIVDGRYLDVNGSHSGIGGDSSLTRNASVSESERALTSKSSDHSEDIARDGGRGFDFSELRVGRENGAGRPGLHGRDMSGGGGIRVTKEVEVRDEGSFDVRQGGYGGRW